MKPTKGSTVRLVHSPSSIGVLGPVARDGTAMICLFIAGRYQLRGPVSLEDVEIAEPGQAA